jgi:hypothetical protein
VWLSEQLAARGIDARVGRKVEQFESGRVLGDSLQSRLSSWRVSVSELLDRIQREIRERLDASRAAVS